ncbi:MAG: N-6 DNA methylase, partial [bacterium]|nr:N-6 DNA methylase [bacterium]
MFSPTDVDTYLSSIESKLATTYASEQSYSSDLEKLISSINDDIEVISQPKKVVCGIPDYAVFRNGLPFGYIETKDIGKKLSDRKYDEQFDRYKNSLDNLIITDYLDFRLYHYGDFVDEAKIGYKEGIKIIHFPRRFNIFRRLINEFYLHCGEPIKSVEKLINIMAERTKAFTKAIENSLLGDDIESNSGIREQYDIFTKTLTSGISKREFSDEYAQTITMGMFVAFMNKPEDKFLSRHQIADYISPRSPFLRSLFRYITGEDLDKNIKFGVNWLLELFNNVDFKSIRIQFKSSTKYNPMSYIYEGFIAAYNPTLRRKRGIFYTPEPIVKFIVNAVDDILKAEFKFEDGLAEYSVISKKHDNEKSTFHKVQILDPALGSGSFLNEAIRNIYSKFKGQEGLWDSYVENHLIPRLNGFELFMAPYALAHFNLEMTLEETGYKPDSQGNRYNIFLTNTLADSKQDADMKLPFTGWFSAEAKGANFVKNEKPIMVILGNPPYANYGKANKGESICKLIADYKCNLNEKKINLDDDYIKFIRYGQSLIDKNEEGVLAYISNNSFLDGVTHRQMRKFLLERFDKIYIINLHGNARKKESSPNGEQDQNVFNIMQGVSINIFIKTLKTKKTEKELCYVDLYGKKKVKYNYLINNRLKSIKWKKISPKEPYYFFVPKDFSLQEDYYQKIKITDIFRTHSAGIKTKVDNIAVDLNIYSLVKRIKNIINNKLTLDEIKSQYGLKDNSTWEYLPGTIPKFNDKLISEYEYRPFDIRFTYYDKKFLSRSRSLIMNNFFNEKNMALELSRNDNDIFIGTKISDEHYISDNSFKFPLYIYDNTEIKDLFENNFRRPNLNMQIVERIAERLKLRFTLEKENGINNFAPIDILDYIYAVLHSPSYCEKYKEFLKIDFPRVPYPESKELFWKLVELGSEIRKLHLLESSKVNNYITEYPVTGTNIVTRGITKKDWQIDQKDKSRGRVWINDQQYFDHVPLVAWEFFIGGYQPAQKWLK